VTQLFYAAQQGHAEVVRLLLANGALATACEKSTGYSAIDVAKQVYATLSEIKKFLFVVITCALAVHFNSMVQRRASFSYEVPSLCKKLRNALISVWSSTVIIMLLT
jgi:hypothetical protein